MKDPGKRADFAAELEQHRNDIAFKDEPWDFEDHKFWMEMQDNEISQVAERLDAILVYTIAFLKSLAHVGEHFLA